MSSGCRKLTASGRGSSPVELRVMPEQVLVVQIPPTAGCRVARKARPVEHRLVQRAQPRATTRRAGAGLREGVFETRDHLRHGQVRVAQACPDHPRPARAIQLEHALEVAEELRQTHGEEVPGAPLRLRLLLLVRVAVAERVVGVEDLDVEIEDRERKLMRPESPWLVPRRELQRAAEKQQDIRRLGDELPAGPENRGRKGRAAHRPEDRKSTRLNSSHTVISYAVFCLKKKKKRQI